MLRGGWGLGREVMRWWGVGMGWRGLEGIGELRRGVKMEGIQGKGRGVMWERIVGLERW